MMSGQGSQYEIIQKLGEGGMGMVYLAKDTMIDRLVAIKQLHRNTGSEEESLGERFQAEALDDNGICGRKNSRRLAFGP